MPHIAMLPESLDGLHLRLVLDAVGHAEAGRRAEAELAFGQALGLAPNDPHVLINYGSYLIQHKVYEEGLAFTRRSLGMELTPEDRAIALQNLGAYELGKRNMKAAYYHLREAISIDPGCSRAVGNLGVAAVVENDWREAYEWFDHASMLDFRSYDACWNKAISLLTMGDWRQGLPGYEERKFEQIPWPEHLPRWQGQSLAGKKIVTWFEQGFGDNIWVHRLVRRLIPMADTVYFSTSPELLPILNTDGLAVVHAGDGIEELHFHVPVMSLMYLLKVWSPAEAGPPAGIRVPESAREKWRGIREEGKINVGVCWSGNINHKYDDLRSIPLAQFIGEGVPAGQVWHGLQKDIRPGDREATGSPGFRWHGEKIETFSDVAAIVAQMDAVLSVDTAALHVVCEMGRPCIGLIPHSPDFRWGTTGRRTPWYPSLTMIRRSAVTADWSPEIEIAKKLISEMVHGWVVSA